MMAQMSSDLHEAGIKLKTTQTIIVWNLVKIQIMPGFLTEDGQFQVLYIL